jgi:hypothetical protein
MKKPKVLIKCLRTFLIGAFLFFTGFAELFLILANTPYDLGTDRDKILRTLVGTVLILWIGSGLCIAIYGKFARCDEANSIREDNESEEETINALE